MPDTGTSRTIINSNIFHRLHTNLQGDSPRCKTANGSRLDISGTARFNISYEGITIETDALVSNDLAENMLISKMDCVRLDIIPPTFPLPMRFTQNFDTHAARTYEKTTENNTACASKDEHKQDPYFRKLLEEFKQVFDDSRLTPMAGQPMSIHLNRDDPTYKPLRVATARKIPIHFEKEAAKTLQWFIDSKVIAKVDNNTFTEWCSPGFFVPKPNGKCRLVVDYKQLNKYVQRTAHPFPSPRDIIKDIKPDSKWFMKLDALQGYYQLPLSKEASDLSTFLLPSGRYKFLRAPMGLNISSDGFCYRTDEILRPVPDLLKIVDDALLQAPTKAELLRRFRLALECCRRHNLTLSVDKIEFGQEIHYAGYLLSANGVKPDPKRLAAITEFPQPTDLKTLRGFLGLANQLGHFMPDLAHMTKPLRQLLKKETAWQWTVEQQRAFDQTKELLTSPSIVQPFKQGREIELLTDASRLCGLGYALMQKEGDRRYLIQCGSRSLNSAETRYATNELECLAICWAIRDCKHYLAGAKFTVITDHRPLVGVFQKPLIEQTNARLLRLQEKLQDYTFTVVWSPGKTNYIADALSRAPVFDPPEKEEYAVNHIIAENLHTILSVKSKEFVQATRDDEEYLLIRKAILDGKKINDLPPNHPARPYNLVWNELSVHGGLILLNNEVLIVPRALRRSMLQNMHKSHAGILRTLTYARKRFYWPNMTKHIKQMINACDECQLHRPSKPTLTVHKRPKAEQPMDELATDLFEFQGKQYIVIIDRYSLYPWVFPLRSTTTNVITNILRTIFSEYGHPRTILSDNGPQFRSEFRKFCEERGISHETSSPYNPRSNGLSEIAVKNMKLLLKKSRNFKDFIDRLTHYRHMPTSKGEKSPAELFFQRYVRSGEFEASELVPYKNKKRHYKDNIPQGKPTLNGKEKQLEPGQTVRVQDVFDKTWTQIAHITKKVSPRSYEIQYDDGKIKIRNIKFLKPLPPNSPVRPVIAPKIERKKSLNKDPLSENIPQSKVRKRQHKMQLRNNKSQDSDMDIALRRSGRTRKPPAFYSARAIGP